MEKNSYDGHCDVCGEFVKARHGVRKETKCGFVTVCNSCRQGDFDVGDPTNIQQALTGLKLGEKTVLDITPGNVAFKLVKEPKPLAISPPRQHRFQAADGFVAYLKKYGGENTVVLCDALTGVCRAVLDEKAATGYEVVTFTPQLHPTFAAWHQIIGVKRNVMELATFVQAQRRSLTNGTELAAALRQIKASTKIELQQGQGNGATNGIMITTKVQGKEGNKDIDLPESITITTPMFVDSVRASVLDLDLTIEGYGDGKGVAATVTAPGLDVLRFEELKEYAKKFDGFTFAFGSDNHGAWKFAE